MNQVLESSQKEKKLKNRRKRRQQGRVIRVSDLVYAELSKLCHGRSLDCALRRHFGMPTREGQAQPLVEGMLDYHTGTMILRLESTWEECEEVARKLADQSSKRMNVPKRLPLKMRELK